MALLPLIDPITSATAYFGGIRMSMIESQTRDQKYGMEHIAIDTDELDTLVAKLKAQGIPILEQTTITGGRRVCFFEGPDGVQLEFIEMKS